MEIRNEANTLTMWNGKTFKPVRGGVARIVFGKGAGYKGGRTLFIALNSGSLRYAKTFTGGKLMRPACLYEYIRIGGLELGFTQNANLVPYSNRT